MVDLSLTPAAPLAAGSEPRSAASERRIQTVVATHFDFVWRILRRLGVPEANLDDGAQQVFLVATRKIGEVPEDRARERSFLFAVALRVASAERRARKRRPELCSDEDDWSDIPDSSPAPDELIDHARARAILDHILDRIPIENRAVFVLYEMEQLTASQIAELLGIPAGTVASRLRRGRELYFQGVNRAKAHFGRAGLP